MKPLARWTIGPATPAGYECLGLSIDTLTSLCDVDVVVCHNCDPSLLPPRVRGHTLFDQRPLANSVPPPLGAAWKLYPPRLDPGRHELVIDNDIVFNRPIREFTEFFSSDRTLLMEEHGRSYGRFERHVPPGWKINSGVYGMPPGFDLGWFVKFYCSGPWEKNAFGEHDATETFDDQGLIAIAMLSPGSPIVMPESTLPICVNKLVPGHGHHFVTLNRRRYHPAYRVYKWNKVRTLL